MARPPSTFRGDAELRRLSKIKYEAPPPVASLGAEMVSFFKTEVQKRHTKLGKVADHLLRLIPEPLLRHCCVDALHRGTLTLLCDSSPHLYDLKQLLLAGLERQILTTCRGAGVRKVSLKLGRWDDERRPGRVEERRSRTEI